MSGWYLRQGFFHTVPVPPCLDAFGPLGLGLAAVASIAHALTLRLSPAFGGIGAICLCDIAYTVRLLIIDYAVVDERVQISEGKKGTSCGIHK